MNTTSKRKLDPAVKWAIIGGSMTLVIDACLMEEFITNAHDIFKGAVTLKMALLAPPAIISTPMAICVAMLARRRCAHTNLAR